MLSCLTCADFSDCRTTSSCQNQKLPSADASNPTARLALADVINQFDRSKQRPLRHNCRAAEAASHTHHVIASDSARDSIQSPHQQGRLADADLAIAAHCAHAAQAHHQAPAEASAAVSQSAARPAPTVGQDEVTSVSSSVALSVDTLRATPLPTSHLNVQTAAAAAASEPAAAAFIAGCTAAESASGCAAAETASLKTAAAAVIKPQSAAARSVAETDNNRPAGSIVGQMDLPLTATLAQAEMPLTKALVQSSGTGCEDVLQMSEVRQAMGRGRQRNCWVSRSFRGNAQSSCTLQLLSKTQHGVSIKVYDWSDSF